MPALCLVAMLRASNATEGRCQKRSTKKATKRRLDGKKGLEMKAAHAQGSCAIAIAARQTGAVCCMTYGGVKSHARRGERPVSALIGCMSSFLGLGFWTDNSTHRSHHAHAHTHTQHGQGRIFCASTWNTAVAPHHAASSLSIEHGWRLQSKRHYKAPSAHTALTEPAHPSILTPQPTNPPTHPHNGLVALLRLWRRRCLATTSTTAPSTATTTNTSNHIHIHIRIHIHIHTLLRTP